MIQGLASTILFSSLPFLIEGVNGLDATPLLKRRQGKLSSPTHIQCLHAFPDPTPTYSSVSSPLLFLRDLRSSLTACTSVNVTWIYAGPSLPLDLIATNATPPSSQTSHVNTFTDDQVFSVPSGTSQSQPVRVSITQGILPQASVVSWNVNVSTGWYQILADLNSTYKDQTDPFYVQLGNDTSCLLSTTHTSTISMSSSSNMPIPVSSGATTAPESTTQRNSSQVSVIIGVVAGAIVFLIIVLTMYLWLRKRKSAAEVRGQSTGAKHNCGRDGLGSLNSTHFERRNHASCDLTSATSHEFAKNGSASCAGDGQHRSDNPIFCSSSVEKLASSPASYTNPFDDIEGGLALATLPISSSKTSLQQLSSSRILPRNNWIYPNEPHDRAPSLDVHTYSSHSSFPSADIDMARSYSASSSTHSPSTDLNHQMYVKEPSSNIPRRMPRKPVPVYDSFLSGPSKLTTPSHAVSYVSSPATPTTPSASSGVAAYSHYSKKLQLNHDGNSLVHKSSFGPGGIEGKQVHYLIPDMPFPRKS